MRRIIVIAHNIRSTHNVGAIFRTCEGLGIERLILTGYTPRPSATQGGPIDDERLPHIVQTLTKQIHKTALGAEELVLFSYHESPPIDTLKNEGYRIVGLEQSHSSISLSDYQPSEKVAILIGEEVDGISPELLAQCQDVVEIPMYGQKESYNVSVATGIALYALRCHT